MRRSLSRFSIRQTESLVPRLLSFAKFNGVTTPRKKLLGSEKRISSRITHTFLLTNPNLEGEIHLKGGRFCNIPNLFLDELLESICISFFCAFWILFES